MNFPIHKVERPAQYLGSEYNSICKDFISAKAKMAFVFPDTYEIGMSYLGLRILYEAVNAHDDLLLERVFCPLADARKILVEQNIPLSSMENQRPLKDFDLVGFTLQYELTYTNILDLLNLAQIPLMAAEREDLSLPLIVAGGPCAYNPEPLADFVDIFCIGEGEEQIPALMNLVAKAKSENLSKSELLQKALNIPGLYVPQFYQPNYSNEGDFKSLDAADFAPKQIKKAIVKDMSTAPFPTKPILPHAQVVHDRIMLEIMRGCSHGCRFCQAGIIYRPVREKPLQLIMDQAAEQAKNSGYEDMGLISLSSADYSQIKPLMQSLLDNYSPCGMALSLPSLRVDAFSVSLAGMAQKVRKSGLTFAPEAGSQRMRDIINKGLTEEDILNACQAAFSQGYSTIKLYFMFGLPYEQMSDIAAIADLCKKIVGLFKNARPAWLKKPLRISLGIASLVPKAHSAFQWHGQDAVDLLIEKQNYLRQLIKPLKAVSLRHHDPKGSLLEAALARGDRRLGAVIKRAWQLGCRMDGWSEYFRYDLWQQAFADNNLTMEQFACRFYGKEEALPWQHISCGIDQDWLWQEYAQAGRGALTEDCRYGKCSNCGVCSDLDCPMQLAENKLDFAKPKFSTDLNAEPKERWRLQLAVKDDARWLGHLDLLAVIEKAIRRADLPIAYSQGFNPHMLISFGPAHPVGLAGNEECLDLYFSGSAPDNWVDTLNQSLTAGLKIIAAEQIGFNLPALMAAAKQADYSIDILDEYNESDINHNIEQLMAKDSWLIERISPKGRKQIDIRPALVGIKLVDNRIYYSCSLNSSAAIKPNELMAIIAPNLDSANWQRHKLHF